MPPTEMSRSELLCCRVAASLRSSSVPPAATHACAITTVRFMPRAAASARMRAVAWPSTVAWLRCRGGSWPASAWPPSGVAGSRRGLVRQAEGGLQVRDAVDGDRSVLVGQHDRLRQPGPVGAQMDAGRVDQRAVDPEPQRRVVVAADQDHPGAGVAEPGERVLAERDRVHRRRWPGRRRRPRRARRRPARRARYRRGGRGISTALLSGRPGGATARDASQRYAGTAWQGQ